MRSPPGKSDGELFHRLVWGLGKLRGLQQPSTHLFLFPRLMQSTNLASGNVIARVSCAEVKVCRVTNTNTNMQYQPEHVIQDNSSLAMTEMTEIRLCNSISLVLARFGMCVIQRFGYFS